MAPRTEVVGKVEIPLQDYLDLVDSDEMARKKQLRLVEISAQLEKFLSFIAMEEKVRKAITEFNSQSSVCQIHIVDNRVKIEMRDETEGN